VKQVADALQHTGHPALGKLEVSTQTGVVTLRGQVPNAYLKVLAMQTALTVSGAWWVVNCLDVSVCPSS
jgi:osmotically-inducible protein OsmY